MYAVVVSGGKQYKVTEGIEIDVERLNAKIGDKINLEVIMLADGNKIKTGNPVVDAEVIAEVVAHGKQDKIIVSNYESKKHTKHRQGHRQPFTSLKIVSVK